MKILISGTNQNIITMREIEVYKLLFSNSWTYSNFTSIVQFIQTRTNEFEIVKMSDGLVTERFNFKGFKYEMTERQIKSPKIRYGIYSGNMFHYIFVLSDGSILVNLPGIKKSLLSKSNP